MSLWITLDDIDIIGIRNSKAPHEQRSWPTLRLHPLQLQADRGLLLVAEGDDGARSLAQAKVVG
eukprot:7616833-Alexandrium_andersonii.AAC.1